MTSATTTLIISGALCLSLCVLMMYRLKARNGKPPSPWINSDFRASTVAIVWIFLLLAGITLIAKGLL